MRTYVLALLLLSCYSYALTAQNCIISGASSYLNPNKVTNPGNSTGLPDGSGATFTDSDSRLTWDLGTGLPSQVKICVIVKKSGSGSAGFTIQHGTSSSSFADAGSFSISNTGYESRCVNISVSTRYIRLTRSNNTDLLVDAVLVSPLIDAGTDQGICRNGTAYMSAIPVSGGIWSARAGNPANASINTPSDPAITITGLTTSGTYGFLWSANGCSDTVLLIVGNCEPGEKCFKSPTNPSIVYAKSTWTYNLSAGTITIRTVLAKTLVDNSYGTTRVGWPKGHNFSDLLESDKLNWSLRDTNGVERLNFNQDYISSDNSRPSGYGCIGFSGDGTTPTVGNATHVVSFNSSLDENFNVYGYNLTSNSPATDINYTTNPTYPNWIFEVWYEVTVKVSAFGNAGFGYPLIPSLHASPSKTGNNSEIVVPVDCNSPVLGSIGDFVWLDANEDGQQQSSERPLPGVEVILTKPGGATQSTFTNEFGKYLFSDLPAGTYSLEFLYPGDSEPTGQNQGDDVTDSDVNSLGLIENIVLGSGQTNLTFDAGLYPTDCDCHVSPENLLTNGGFESTGGWSTGSSSLLRSSGYQMCGNYHGQLDHKNPGPARLFQNVTGIEEGASVTLSGFIGKQGTISNCNPQIKLKFYSSGNVLLREEAFAITVDVNQPDHKLEFFIIATSAPAGTSYAQVEIVSTCDYVLMDGLCLVAEGGGGQQLPIQSLVFKPLETYKDEIKLSWTTLNEQNTDRFEIFRSTDNMQTWTKVSDVPALGQSSGQHTYAYMDRMDKIYSKVSYKITQRDLDGKSYFTEYRTIQLKSTHLAMEGNPNPFRSLYRLQIQSVYDETLSVDFLDIMGRSVFKDKFQVRKGFNVREFQLSQLPPGTYKLRISGLDNFKTVTVVKTDY